MRLETHGRVDGTVMILKAGCRQNPFLFEGPQFSHLRLSIDCMGPICMMEGQSALLKVYDLGVNCIFVNTFTTNL